VAVRDTLYGLQSYRNQIVSQRINFISLYRQVGMDVSMQRNLQEEEGEGITEEVAGEQ
jgi:hypothetical protein